MNDFDTWLQYYRRLYPDEDFTDNEAREAYDAFYDCDCGSCVRRKSMPHGLPMPITTRCRLRLDDREIRVLGRSR